MTKLGTCKYTFQIQEAYSFSADIPVPKLEDMERHRIIDTSDMYTCQWLNQYGHETLPPPVRRANGGFHIRTEDCDECIHYQPAHTTADPA